MPRAVLSWILRLGIHFWTKGAVAGRAANACLLDSQGGCCAILISRGSPMAVSLDLSPSLCVSVCLSLGLPQSLFPNDEAEKADTPCPSIFPH